MEISVHDAVTVLHGTGFCAFLLPAFSGALTALHVTAVSADPWSPTARERMVARRRYARAPCLVRRTPKAAGQSAIRFIVPPDWRIAAWAHEKETPPPPWLAGITRSLAMPGYSFCENGLSGSLRAAPQN